MRLDPLSGVIAFITVAEQQGFSAAARVLGVSASALSQAVRTLEQRVGTPLLVRTTRTVRLTEAGERLFRRCNPALHEALNAVDEVARGEDEVAGRLRLTVPHLSVPFVEALVLHLRREHPRLSLEVTVEDRFVDLLGDGFDAGVRLLESTNKDMVAVRLTPPFRFVVVGSPSYFKERGKPQRPREVLKHECIGYRAMSTGAIYAWEFEDKRREYRITVTGSLVTNDATFMVRAATQGLGLAYVSEPSAALALRASTLETVLDDFTPRVPGLFVYFPASVRAQPKIQALVRAAHAVDARQLGSRNRDARVP